MTGYDRMDTIVCEHHSMQGRYMRRGKLHVHVEMVHKDEREGESGIAENNTLNTG